MADRPTENLHWWQQSVQIQSNALRDALHDTAAAAGAGRGANKPRSQFGTLFNFSPKIVPKVAPWLKNTFMVHHHILEEVPGGHTGTNFGAIT